MIYVFSHQLQQCILVSPMGKNRVHIFNKLLFASRYYFLDHILCNQVVIFNQIMYFNNN